MRQVSKSKKYSYYLEGKLVLSFVMFHYEATVCFKF